MTRLNKFTFLLSTTLLLGACQTTGLGMGMGSSGQIPYGITPADSQMSCGEMQAEFNRMDQIIAQAQTSRRGGNNIADAGRDVARDAMHEAGYGEHRGMFDSLSNMADQMTGTDYNTLRQQADAARTRRDQLLDLAYRKGCISTR